MRLFESFQKSLVILLKLSLSKFEFKILNIFLVLFSNSITSIVSSSLFGNSLRYVSLYGLKIFALI